MKRLFFMLTTIAWCLAVAMSAQQTPDPKRFEPMLTAESPKFQCRIPLETQPNNLVRIISGKIIDNKSLKPVLRCKVFLKETTYMTTCDANGVFSLKIPLDKMNEIPLLVEIKAFGYKKQEFELTEKVRAQDIALLPIRYKLKPKKERDCVVTICPHF